MNSMKKLYRAVPATVLLSVLLFPVVAFAVVEPIGTAITKTRIENFIDTIAQFLIGIAMTVAVIFIVWGGIKWITARGDEKAVKAAQQIVWQGILGALVILAVGVILSTLKSLVTGGSGFLF